MIRTPAGLHPPRPAYRDRTDEFARKYCEELSVHQDPLLLLDDLRMRGGLTLLCDASDTALSHGIVLKDVLIEGRFLRPDPERKATMKASDIMTSAVITVTPETSLHDIVEILLAHRISGVLVMEDDKVVGVVGDGDLLHRHEIGTDHWGDYRTWWQRLTHLDPAPAAYVRANGGRARDVMSSDFVSVSVNAPLSQIAVIFEARNIRRIPVLERGELKGLVTRADLMRALAASDGFSATPAPPGMDDESIRKNLLAELSRQSWWSGTWSNVFVNNGIVSYVGVVQRAADRDAARIAAENIPGVCGVEDRRLQYGEWQPMF